MTRRDVVGRTIKAIDNAASAIEAKEAEIARLSKALSESEAERAEDSARLKVQRDNALLDMEEFMKRTEATESRLSEAMKVIEPFTRIPLAFTDDIDDSATVFEFEGGAITLGDLRRVHAARVFLNAGKE